MKDQIHRIIHLLGRWISCIDKELGKDVPQFLEVTDLVFARWFLRRSNYWLNIVHDVPSSFFRMCAI